MLIFWLVFGIFCLFVIPSFIYFGVRLCLDDNALGVFVLFFGINIFGLVLGICILVNNKNKDFQERTKLNKQRTKITRIDRINSEPDVTEILRNESE